MIIMNIIGKVIENTEIELEKHHIKCDTGLCGDACDERWRCEDCEGEILGKCLHIEMKIKTSAMVWDGVDEMCDACGKCTLWGWE